MCFLCPQTNTESLFHRPNIGKSSFLSDSYLLILVLFIAEPHTKLQFFPYTTFCFPRTNNCTSVCFVFYIPVNSLSPRLLTGPSIFSLVVQTQEVTYSSRFPLEPSLLEPFVTLLLSGALLPSSDPGICIYHHPGDSLQLSSVVDLLSSELHVFSLSYLGYLKKGSMGS